MSKNNLEVKNLEMNYLNNGFSLDKINFSVPKGSIVGLIGENGSGKTTTMNLILDLRKKSSGSVKIFDQEYHSDNVEIKELLGVSFDDITLPKNLTAKEISKIYKYFYEKWDECYFFTKLSNFGIDQNKRINDYSKGMQKMLSIILSMSHHPELLILDEPTSSLDPVRRQEILSVFQEYVIDDRNSILFSSHITTDIEQISDYVVYINKGKLVFFEPITKLLYDYALVRCTSEAFTKIPKNKIIAFQKKELQHIALLNSREGLDVSESELIVENPTLEGIMNIFSKGVIL